MSHYSEFYEEEYNLNQYIITPKFQSEIREYHQQPPQHEIEKRLELFKMNIFDLVSIEEKIFIKSTTQDVFNSLFSYSLEYNPMYQSYRLIFDYNRKNNTYYFKNREVDRAGGLETYVKKITLKNKFDNF